MATLFPVDGSAVREVFPANGSKFTLEELQGYVGGLIEAVYTRNGQLMYVNEEGLFTESPVVNGVATALCGTPLVGPAILLTAEEAEEEED